MKFRCGRNFLLCTITVISLGLISRFCCTQAVTIASETGITARTTNSSGDPKPSRNIEFARSSDFSTQETKSNIAVLKKSRHRPKSRTVRQPATESSAPILPKFDSPSVLSAEVGTGRACGIAPVSTTTISTILNQDLVSGEIGALIGGAGVAKAIAIAIAVAIAVHWWWIVKIAIGIAIWWWWYGEGGKKDDEGYLHGWTTPVPVYGPPKPQYGAPVSGYGRQLYESLDFSHLSEKVLKALDFFEKHNLSETSTTHPESRSYLR